MSFALSKKYHDLLARETGYCRKLWGARIAVCLVYPNVYRAGMSNLGFQTVYALLNADAECLCERAFLPDPGDEAAFAPGSTPLFSLESQRPLSDFDIVAFSVSFENDYPNILKVLSLARITPETSRRGEKDPLVLGGGIAVTLNPEPIADFFDLFLIGEGEEVLPEFLSALKDGTGLSRKDLLFSLQRDVPGVYVPGLYEVIYRSDHLISAVEPTDPVLPRRIRKRRASLIDSSTAGQCISTALSEFGDMFLVEVSRGCGRGCRFCAAGFVYRPARFRTPEALQPALAEGIAQGRKIGLLGTAVSDHPELMALCRSILEMSGRVAIGSLRVDRLTDELAGVLAESGIETLALAPEAGSQRLREIIRKGITEEDIMSAVESLMKHGILRVRLYFMVGLPTETEEDIEDIIRLVKRIKHHAVKYTRGRRGFRLITLSINQFIPKPATPFQWQPLAETGTVRKKIRRIHAGLRGEPSIRVTHDLPKWNYIQALLSLGDRRVGAILLAVHRAGGNWSHAFREVNINPDFYVYREKGADEILPWDFIDHGIDKDYLLRECRAAIAPAVS